MKLKLMAVMFLVSSAFLFTQCNGEAVKDSEEDKKKRAKKEEKKLMKKDHKKVAILVTEGFHDGEAYMPMAYLANRGIKSVVIGPAKGEVKAYNSDFTIMIHKAVADVDMDCYDALILPGGRAPAKLREDEDVLAFVKNFYATGKPTAAICHGPQVLISAGLMQGKTCTAFPEVEQELVDAGAHFVDESIVVDGNLITSRVPKDLHDFSKAIYKALKEK